MKIRRFALLSLSAILLVALAVSLATTSKAQSSGFRNAPASAAEMKNPYAGNAQAAAAGKKLFGQNCAQCHGANLRGIGPAPALESASVRQAKPGELFWFITNGKLTSGMPSWANLPKQQRWQIVTFLQSKNSEKTAAQ